MAEGENVQEWFDEHVAGVKERAEDRKRLKEASKGQEAPEMEFTFPLGGEYSGAIGGEFGSIKVPESGVFRTRNAAEQAFIRNLGYPGELTKRGEKVVEKAAVAANEQEA